jgi:hypothetical protein
MSYTFEKQPAYEQTLSLIRTVDEKLQYTKRHRDKRIPEMERFLDLLQETAACIARTHAGGSPQHAAHARCALENAMAACPALSRLLQMDIVSSSEHDDFRHHLDAIAKDLTNLISSYGA